jgi:hypothetical protein
MIRFDCAHKNYNGHFPSMGNAITETQFSSYIRSENDLECNRHSFEKGELLQYDLNNLPSYIPSWVKHEIRGYCQNRRMIFFCLRHFRKGKPIVLAYLITDTNHNLAWVLGPEEMLEDGQYITEDGASFERVSVYAEVLAESAFARSLRPTGAEINVPIGDAAFLLAADALHRSGPFTEVFFTSYGQAFSSDQFRIHSVDTPDLVLPEDMKGVRMGKKDLATFCKLARMYKAKTIKLAIFTSERGAVCVRGEFGPVSATSLCGAPDDKAEAFVAALRKFESDAARCAVPVGRLGLKHAEFVAALKVFKGKSPARLAHAYISEEGHLCPWGDRRRSAIIAQTSVKHGGGVAINLGFLKDSGAWDQDFYVARPGAMGAGQKASILISRANGRTMTVSCLRG